MIIPADTTVNFSGPRALDQAVTFVDECPPGAAVLVGNGSAVKMLRSVESRFVLAEKETVRRFGRGEKSTPKPVVPVFAVLVYFMLSLASEGAWGLGEPSGGALISGGIVRAPAAFLGAVTLSEAQIGMGVLALIAALIGYHFAFQKYIRDAMGVKEAPKAMNLEGQPIEVKGVVRYVAHEELAVKLESYVTSDELHATEQRLDGKMEENFRSLDEKRSRSIGNLHEHLTATDLRLSTKVEQEVAKTHIRIDALAGKQGELIGEIKHLTTAVSDAAKAAQAAAIAAASVTKGGKP